MSGLTNLMLAIPSLVFALAIMAILGPGLVSLVIALGLTSWSYSCRIARAQVLSLKSQGYVQAARILGYGDLRIMFTQVLPNILGPLIVIATLGMGGAILAEAALSFLGLGIRPPFPSWGSMLSEARDQIRAAPWLSVFPGLAIFFTVLGLNLLGDGLRDILDPQSTDARAHERSPCSRSTTCTSPFAGDGATYNAVEDVSFEIGRGEAFGLVGELGCGKSITALAVMGLLRRPLSLGERPHRARRRGDPGRLGRRDAPRCAATASP